MIMLISRWEELTFSKHGNKLHQSWQRHPVPLFSCFLDTEKSAAERMLICTASKPLLLTSAWLAVAEYKIIPRSSRVVTAASSDVLTALPS